MTYRLAGGFQGDDWQGGIRGDASEALNGCGKQNVYRSACNVASDRAGYFPVASKGVRSASGCQHSLINNKINNSLKTGMLVQIGKYIGIGRAHALGIAIHYLQVCPDMRCQIDFVNHQ